MSNTTPGLPTPPRPCLNCTQPTRNQGQRCDTCTTTHTRNHNRRTKYYRTPEWKALRTQALNRDWHQCVICAHHQRLAIHHIKARRQGGEDTLPNLVTLCTPCHSRIERNHKPTIALMQQHLDATRQTQ